MAGVVSSRQFTLAGKSKDPLVRTGGISAMASSLRRIGDEELSKEMRAASKEAAAKIVPYSKAMVPVVSGRLRNTIRADATRRYGRILAGTPTTVPYAWWVHRGRYLGKGKRTQSTPFISKAIRKGYPEVVEDYVKAMNRIAKKFEKKHGVSRVYGSYR